MKHYYIINKRNNYLTSHPWSEFCCGIRGFSKNSAIAFNSKEDAQEYISYLLKKLDEWIKKDIPEQSKNWRNDKNTPIFNHRDTFLKKSQERYIKNKKIINSLKIIDFFE